MPYLLEFWKPIVGFEGIYEVSNVGNVRRALACPGARPLKLLALKRYKLTGDGSRFAVNLYKDHRVKRIPVHALVAAAFIGPRPQGLEVNHKNGNRLDNRVSNLEYITPEANREHAILNRLFPHGERTKSAKLKAVDVVAIRRLSSDGVAPVKIASLFGVSRGAIHHIKNGNTWKHVA